MIDGDLKPCPFCGHREIRLAAFPANDPDSLKYADVPIAVGAAYVCRRCGARGGIVWGSVLDEHSERIACELWNRRGEE